MTFEIKIPIYREIVKLYVGKPKGNDIYSFPHEDIMNTVDGTTWNEESYPCMWIPDFQNIPVIAHESLHVANAILESKGISISTDNDETQAYLLEFILNEILSLKNDELSLPHDIS